MNVFLLIFTYFSALNGGGASAVVTQIPMASMAACEAAAQKVRQSDTYTEKEIYRLNVHSREAVCIENAVKP